ncbi:MAG: phosphotransferase [Thermoleophilaceae bacterium]|nr:phosphotransferase [Thermoleophilaceae bacterium]
MRPGVGVAGGPPGRAAEAPPPQTLWDLVRSSGLRSLVLGASKDPNAKITTLLVSPESGRPVLAVKVPTTDAAARAVAREARVLSELPRLGAPVGATIPRVVGSVEFRGRPGIVMTAASGTPMTTSYLRRRHAARRERVARHFAAVGGWLAELQRATAGPPARIDMDGGVASRLASRFWSDVRLADDLAALAEIHSRLARSATPRTAVHGDLWVGNVLLDGERVSGVVDWEGGAGSGEPLRDLARFALTYALFLDRRTRSGRRVPGHPGLRADRWGAGVEYALDASGWFPDLVRRFLADGLARLGAPRTLWRDAALAGIAEIAALTDDPGFARAHLELFRRLARAGRPRADL